MELTRALPDNRPLRSVGGAMLDSTAGEAFGAAFGTDTLTNLVAREFELSRTQPARSGRNARFRDDVNREPLLSPDELNERFGDSGATFDRAMPEEAGRIIADARRAQRIREDVIARGPGGVLGITATLGGSLAAMAVDPLEVASAFIPIVGPASRAAMTARLGRVGARAAEGVIEGAVGNAIVEPFYYGLSQRQGQDYNAYDALANVALGGALGLGLGGAAGLVARLRGGAAPRAVDPNEPPFSYLPKVANAPDVSRVALAQVAQGREVDVAPIARIARPRTVLETLQGMGLTDPGGDLRSMGLRDWDKSQHFRRNIIRSDGMSQDDAARQLWEYGYFRDDPEAMDMEAAMRGERVEPDTTAMLKRAIDDELRGEPHFSTWDARDVEAWRNSLGAEDAQKSLERVSAELSDIGVTDATRWELERVGELLDEGVDIDTAWERASIESVNNQPIDMARTMDNPANAFSGDPAASVQAQRVADTPFDVDGDIANLSEMAGQLRLTDDELAFVAEADDMIAKAAAFRDTARAAALCLAR